MTMTNETMKPVCDCAPEGDIARDRRPTLHQEHCALLRWCKQAVADPTIDPTTASIEAQSAEREKLRVEIARLEKALVALETLAARTDVEVRAKLGDALFVKGYDQAVREIHDHFKNARQDEVVAEIEKIWIKEKLPPGTPMTSARSSVLDEAHDFQRFRCLPDQLKIVCRCGWSSVWIDLDPDVECAERAARDLLQAHVADAIELGRRRKCP